MNVLLMILDALRYDHVNRETTPSLMEVASRGVFFTNAFACNSSTIESMPCILCSDTEYDPENNLATILNGHGIHTAMIHSNPIVHAFYHGFKETIDLESKKFKMSKSWKKTLRESLPPQVIAGLKKVRATIYEDDQYLPYARAKETLGFTSKWIGDHERFFLWTHIMEPHIPYYPLKTSLDITRHEMRTLNDRLIESVHGNYEPSPEEVEVARVLYKEDIMEMDEEIGGFVETLDPEDLLVITSDHGEEFGEYGQFSHHSDKIVPELTHVPLMFIGGGVKPGLVMDERVSSLSIAPTILEALKVNEKLGRGSSLWGRIKG